MKLISAITAITIVCGVPTAANAKPVLCAFGANGQVKINGVCDHQQRRNNAGILVNDITWPDGVRSTNIYWRNGVAEIISNGKSYTGLWRNDYISTGAPITVINHTNGPATIIGGHVTW